MSPLRVIHAVAPVRICDNGGWTDTWVARHGKVFNIAVRPYVSAQIAVFARGTREARIVLNAKNYDTRYALALDQPGWGPQPLLEATVRTVPPADDVDVEISVESAIPAGASTGTSATVVVSLLGALHALAGNRRTAVEIAYEAHAVETVSLGGESGIQDQLCAATGGLNFIEIVEYPRAILSPLDVPREWRTELESRLALVYLGRPHSSNPMHEKVLRELKQTGPDDPRLNALRRAATDARDAALAGHFDALGRALRENTDVQASLHADLVSADARRIIEIAAAHGALGWKVNGAGGDGGSVTLLGDGNAGRTAAMIQEIEQDNPAVRRIPIALSDDGLRVTLLGAMRA
jgi:D-glycero-alpha-D-manno-heptose-7-phosphate kinase